MLAATCATSSRTSAALAGFSSGAGPLRAGTLPSAASPVLSVAPEGTPPRAVRVDRLGIAGDLVGLRTGPDGVLQVPEDADRPGWYRQGVVPGDLGPAVVVGHVDSYEGAGVFFRLRELVPGDRVSIERIDGSVIDFEVYGIEAVRKDGFPTARVYGPTEGPELRLITCGGSFDRAARSYTENVVAYARLVPPPAAS